MIGVWGGAAAGGGTVPCSDTGDALLAGDSSPGSSVALLASSLARGDLTRAAGSGKAHIGGGGRVSKPYPIPKIASRSDRRSITGQSYLDRSRKDKGRSALCVELVSALQNRITMENSMMHDVDWTG